MARKTTDIELLSTEEVCKLLNIAKPTFYRLVERGELKAKRVGKGYKVLKENLVAFLNQADKPRKRKKRRR